MMGIEFNAGQKMVIEDALRFYKSPSEQVFEFAGVEYVLYREPQADERYLR